MIEKQLKDLKIGDKVYYYENHSNRIIISTIQRITKTLFITDDKRKFNRETGKIPACNDYYALNIRPLTSDILRRSNIQKLQTLFDNLSISVDNDNYEELLEEYKKLKKYSR